MIDPEHKLPITRQTKLLQIARSTVYYLPVCPSVQELAIMEMSMPPYLARHL
jgi:hypothetical protein